jgi:phosphoglycerate dehydrogenase-like enzyme
MGRTNMKIVVLESIAMTADQREALEQLGQVEWFDSSTEAEAIERTREKDVVVVDWVDPSPFLLNLKSPSLVTLMSTGYAWIQHRDEARGKDVLIANIPAYATEAVAEHLIGLSLCVMRRIAEGDRHLRSGHTSKGSFSGTELKGKTFGIIGLGNIGGRVAELARAFGMEIVTNNRTPKLSKGIKDLKLDELLSTSDVVAVTCSLNNDSRGMLDRERLNLMKPGAILVGTTWDVVIIEDILALLERGKLGGLGFDVAIEGGEIKLPDRLFKFDNVVLTPHVGFNTIEAKRRQVDTCIDNIRAFAHGTPKNIVN